MTQDRDRLPSDSPAPDRISAPNSPDLVDLNQARFDMADFKPSLGAGAALGSSAFVDGSGVNLYPNGEFEEGVGNWSAAGTGTLSADTAIFYQGTQSCLITPTGVNATMTFNGEKQPVPAGVGALNASAWYWYNGVTAIGTVYLVMSFYDDSGAVVGRSQTLDQGYMVLSTWIQVTGTGNVPVGATQFVVTVNGAFASAPAAIETSRLDSVVVTAGSSYDGYHTGQGNFHQGVTNLAVNGGSFANHAVSAANVWEDIGSAFIIVFPDATMPVQVSATGHVRVDSALSATPSIMRFRVGLSTDGGVSYSWGNEVALNGGTGAGAISFGTLSTSHRLATFLPVGGSSIMVSLQSKQDTNTGQVHTFSFPNWTAVCCPLWANGF